MRGILSFLAHDYFRRLRVEQHMLPRHGCLYRWTYLCPVMQISLLLRKACRISQFGRRYIERCCALNNSLTALLKGSEKEVKKSLRASMEHWEDLGNGKNGNGVVEYRTDLCNGHGSFFFFFFIEI